MSTSPTPETPGAEVEIDGGDGVEAMCLRGLKISTMINPKIIRRSKKMHFLLPVLC
jgi:hypothetical protein